MFVCISEECLYFFCRFSTGKCCTQCPSAREPRSEFLFHIKSLILLFCFQGQQGRSELVGSRLLTLPQELLQGWLNHYHNIRRVSERVAVTLRLVTLLHMAPMTHPSIVGMALSLLRLLMHA